MTTYLVTGGAGFIGANFVKYILAEHGQEIKVVILDALTYAGNLLTIKDELNDPRVTFVKGDIGDRDLVDKILAEHDPNYIVNFAAESHVDRSITGPRIFLETNILGTQTLLDAARVAWRVEDGGYKPGHKFLQISTDEVYGSLPVGYDEPQPLTVSDELREVVKDRGELHTFGTQFFTESTPLQPHSPYSASKTSADMFVMAYHDTYGLPVNITRCSNNYGPYHFPEKLIPLMIKNLLEGKQLPVYGQGLNVRDWLYVEDHARAIDLVLRRGRVGEVYNIGGFNEHRNIDLVKELIKIVAELMFQHPEYQKLMADPERPLDETRIQFVTDRPGHDMRYAIDPTKIATELRWYPKTPLSQGLKATVEWYLNNQPWVESVTSGDYQKYYEQMYGNR
ncbi:MAG: dTDP-glucose 4,6-dehydratase [Bacteroidales bacterium]|nr:dTDP-glucose 4,6-dehydratase [Bacteroidales bacterium]